MHTTDTITPPEEQKTIKAPKAPKAPKEPKVPKVPKEPKAPKVPRYRLEECLTWHVSTNPKRAGSAAAARFADYMGAPTVEAFLAAGGSTGDLAWDVGRRFVTAG